MEILSYAENAIHPKVDLVKGHIPFAEMGAALAAKYSNPDFSDSYLRYEYAQFGNFEVNLPPTQGVDENGETVELELEGEPITEQLEVLLNRKPNAEGCEPVTVLYYGNYSVPQA